MIVYSNNDDNFASTNLPLTFKLGMISSMVVPASKGALSAVRLVRHKLLVSVDAFLGIELLATTIADKQMATMLSNFERVRHWQRLESLSCALSPHIDPIQQNHESPHKPALDTCRSMCHKINNFFKCYLKLIPVFKVM